MLPKLILIYYETINKRTAPPKPPLAKAPGGCIVFACYHTIMYKDHPTGGFLVPAKPIQVR